MMNAELEAAKYSRSMIPTVYLEDYLLALRRLSRQKDSIVYVKMMLRVQAFNTSISFENYAQALMKLKVANAFQESSEGKLIIPDKWMKGSA
jgi:hypothetical protein